MKKIFLFGIATILFVTLVLAATISLNETSLFTIDNTPVEVSPVTPNTVEFNCDGSPMTVDGTKPDGTYDKNDLESLTRGHCEGVVTSIKVDSVDIYEYDGRVGTYAEMKADECSAKNGDYDSGKDQCTERVEEVVEEP